jgi:hypothetical protein
LFGVKTIDFTDDKIVVLKRKAFKIVSEQEFEALLINK